MPNTGATPSVTQNIDKPAVCLNVLLSQFAWGRFSELDGATSVGVAGPPVNVTALAMSGGNTMKYVTADSLKAVLTIGYTREQGFYENTLAIDLTTLSPESSAAIQDAQTFCDIFFWTKGTDKLFRILGLEYIDGEFVQPFDCVLDAHDATMGGGNVGTNIMTFRFRTNIDVTPTTVTYANLPL